ncbi:MAG: 50S ribosomal protein L22 [candidate division WOR-3 bacterium]|nr:MAG: 50S ribosomal protein L22 [candidate division WOR-3 bacterium]
MQATATSRFQRGSAKKLGQIATLVRGKDVPEALRALTFLAKPSKGPVLKTLRSAVANAINKAGKAKLHEEDLYVAEARVDQGPALKRWRPAPRGMASLIRKKTCHVHIRVETKKEVEV